MQAMLLEGVRFCQLNYTLDCMQKDTLFYILQSQTFTYQHKSKRGLALPLIKTLHLEFEINFNGKRNNVINVIISTLCLF